MVRSILLLGALLYGTIASAQTIDPGSAWVNSRGSELTIDAVGDDGAISGTYINRAEGFACRDKPFAVSGWVQGDLISFVVLWNNGDFDCNSITSWTGHLDEGEIAVDWDLVYVSAETGKPAHLKDSDRFTPH